MSPMRFAASRQWRVLIYAILGIAIFVVGAKVASTREGGLCVRLDQMRGDTVCIFANTNSG